MERNVRCSTERLGIKLIASRRNNDFNLHNISMLNRTKLSLSVFRLFLLPLEKIDDETGVRFAKILFLPSLRLFRSPFILPHCFHSLSYDIASSVIQ